MIIELISRDWSINTVILPSVELMSILIATENLDSANNDIMGCLHSTTTILAVILFKRTVSCPAQPHT